MATHALSPAPLPANNDRAAFNAALARYADATAARDALPCSSPIERELAAGNAFDLATNQLAAVPAPDLPAFATKLRVILADLGTPPLLVDASPSTYAVWRAGRHGHDTDPQRRRSAAILPAVTRNR